MSGHLPQSTYSQVSKALCGKENATLKEILEAVDQLKSSTSIALSGSEAMLRIAPNMFKRMEQLEARLAQAERDRDAAVADLIIASMNLCSACKHDSWPECGKTGRLNLDADDAVACENFEWRGACEENTKEESK